MTPANPPNRTALGRHPAQTFHFTHKAKGVGHLAQITIHIPKDFFAWKPPRGYVDPPHVARKRVHDAWCAFHQSRKP